MFRKFTALIAASLISFSVFASVIDNKDAPEIQIAAANHILALASGDYESAYNGLTEENKATFSFKDFRTFMRENYSDLKNGDVVGVGAPELSKGQVVQTVKVETDTGVIIVVCKMAVHSDGTWRIDSVRLLPFGIIKTNHYYFSDGIF